MIILRYVELMNLVHEDVISTNFMWNANDYPAVILVAYIDNWDTLSLTEEEYQFRIVPKGGENTPDQKHGRQTFWVADHGFN